MNNDAPQSKNPGPINTCGGMAAGRSAPIYTFDFSKALSLLKDGQAVARYGWNGRGMFIRLQTPDYNSKMSRPYLYIVTRALGTIDEKDRTPWLASHADLFGEDWYIVSPE